MYYTEDALRKYLTLNGKFDFTGVKRSLSVLPAGMSWIKYNPHFAHATVPCVLEDIFRKQTFQRMPSDHSIVPQLPLCDFRAEIRVPCLDNNC